MSYTNKNTKGFSLVEAMIATAVFAIGFVGIYSMVSLSERFTKWATARQDLIVQAEQMFNIIDVDIENIDNYNLNLATCTDPGVATDTYLIRAYQWCIRMNEEVGAAGGSNIRSITITRPTPTRRNVRIRLEAYNANVQIILERAYAI